jgi:protein involved in polysaccharide export with SLBB domain
LINLLSLAGGPVEEVADLRRARLRHAGSSEEIPVDLEAVYYSGDTSQNYTLQDGDELIVPKDTHNRVVVWGAVQQPGTYPYTKNMRVMDAIGLTRGEIRTVSRMSKVVILRKRKGQYDASYPIRVDLVRLMNQHDWTQNIELEREDFIFVPSTKTPNFNDIGAILNTAFFANRVFFQEGIFGFRPLNFIGR